jgi:hypothetical protein
MEDGSMGVMLQLAIIFLCLVIVILLYFERANTSNIRQKVDEFECPTCPTCPDCPACECNEEGCPDCVCPEPSGCPACPKCPDVNTSCPSQSTITADEIVDAIFPGRNKGFTSYGEYFPLDGLGESNVEAAYSPVTNLMPNYVGGDGTPAAISFQDQTLLNQNSSLGLAAQKDPPIQNNQGVMSDNSGSQNTGMATDSTTSQPTGMATDSTATDSTASQPVSSPTSDTVPTGNTSSTGGLMSELTGGFL